MVHPRDRVRETSRKPAAPKRTRPPPGSGPRGRPLGALWLPRGKRSCAGRLARSRARPEARCPCGDARGPSFRGPGGIWVTCSGCHRRRAVDRAAPPSPEAHAEAPTHGPPCLQMGLLGCTVGRPGLRGPRPPRESGVSARRHRWGPYGGLRDATVCQPRDPPPGPARPGCRCPRPSALCSRAPAPRAKWRSPLGAAAPSVAFRDSGRDV